MCGTREDVTTAGTAARGHAETLCGPCGSERERAEANDDLMGTLLASDAKGTGPRGLDPSQSFPMTAQLQMRRLNNFGWLIETREGEPRAIKRDDGLVFHVDVRLVGTREQLASSEFGMCASSAIGHLVRTSLHPWPCSRADGWRSSDVRAYAERRRAPRVSHERLKEIARRNVWWQAPAETLANPLDFAARVMARGTLQEMDDIERPFGRPALEAALDRASPGVVDPRS